MSIENVPSFGLWAGCRATLFGWVALLVLAGSGAEVPDTFPHRSATHRLRAIADPSMSPTWRVGGIELDENLAFTDGTLVIQNSGELPVSHARFYLEYYDAAGRPCFSLAFATENSGRRVDAPIAPGESRKLYSEAAYLGPATEPVEARVFMVSQVRGSVRETGVGDAIMRIPVTGGVAQEVNLDLDRVKDAPIVDLVLGQVWVDSEGKLQRSDILSARDNGLRLWFQSFVTKVQFDPAASGALPTAGTALILVRAVRDRMGDADPVTLLSRRSEWLKEYDSHLGAAEPPPVIQLSFIRSPLIGSGNGPGAAAVRAQRSISVNRYELSAMLGWSDQVMKLVRVGDTRQFVRQWRAPEDYPHH